VVVAGDTLSGIAKDVLQDGKLWPQIWEQNEHIINPHWIYPNDRILIRPVTKITEAKPPEPGEPAAAPEPAQVAETPKETPVVREPPKPFIVPPYPNSDPPRGPQVILDLTPPRVFPEVKSADVYCSGFIRDANVPRDIKVIARYGNDLSMSNTGDYVYVSKGVADAVRPGTTYEVVRPTKKVNSLGTHYLEVAQVEIVMGQSNFAMARVTQGCEAVELGDVLIPYTRSEFPALAANRPFSGTMKPSGQVPGRIVTTKSHLLNSGSKYTHQTGVPVTVYSGNLAKYNEGVAGEGNVVYLDVGQGQGVKPGDLFIVFRDVITIDGSTPVDSETKEKARRAVAELVVLKVEDRASTALVTYSADMISPGDSVERR
jgi:LysM repeat protein